MNESQDVTEYYHYKHHHHLARFTQQGNLSNDDDDEDKLCFRDIFGDNLVFGIILCLLVALFLILFVWLVLFWYRRRYWFPMQERSTYCTLCFLIACTVNFFIQPFLLIIYNLLENNYSVEGRLEAVFKFFYIFSRFSMTTLYIAKVTRLSQAFSLKQRIGIFYKYLVKEWFILFTAIAISMVISLSLVLTTERSNIVLSIEKGFTQNVQQFWVPVQCIEVMVICTLFFMMQNVAPYYKMNKEIFSLFIINIILSTFSYLLYISIPHLDNYCQHGTDTSTYLMFAINQVRTLFSILFCVYFPLTKSTEKAIPLPSAQVLNKTKEGENAIRIFFLVFSLFNQELYDPFAKFLKHADEEIEKQSQQGLQILQRIDQLSRRYPLIKYIQSFEMLFQCYEEISYAVEFQDHKKMEQVVSQYIEVQDLAPQNVSNNNHNNDMNNVNNLTQLFAASSNGSSNILSFNNDLIRTSNPNFSNNPMIQRVNSAQNIPFYKKCFCLCKKKKKIINKKEMFRLDENTYIKIIDSFSNSNSHPQSIEHSSIQLQMKKDALKQVQDEIFLYVHLMWQEFFSRTKSFSYLDQLFIHYGSVKNHLLAFNLANYEYEKEENDILSSERNSSVC